MQNIEINTTQNVRITYELANVADRIFAFLIDLLIIGGGCLVFMFLSSIITGDGQSYVFYILIVPFAAFYTVVSEILMKGQTLGKRALKIQVVKLNGIEPTNIDYFLKWVFRLIDIYLSLGMIAIIFIVTSKKRQRLGDLVCETSAVRVKPSGLMKFSDIEQTHDHEHYTPRYREVVRLEEKDMLLVQTVILRYKKYKNLAHHQALEDLTDVLKKKLGIQEDGSSELFLKTILQDYIYLTR